MWLGNDDDSPTKKVSGGNLPVEVWSRFMKGAHEGVPVAALPLSNFRTASAPNPLASFLPPLDLTGAQGPAPPSGGRGGARPPVAAGAPAPAGQPAARSAPAPVVDSAPVPPAPIPNASQPGQRANDFLNKFFGRLAGPG